MKYNVLKDLTIKYLADDCTHQRMNKKRRKICHIMTGNGINMCTIKESLVALHIQRRHKIDKDYRST